MKTLAIAHLRDIRLGVSIARHLEAIDATLAPFGGRFPVHRAPVEPVEGAFDADVVITAFPDHEAARRWYDSPAYQQILPLRTDSARCDAFFVDTFDERHRAPDLLPALFGETVP